jgi:hypothetical protein
LSKCKIFVAFFFFFFFFSTTVGLVEVTNIDGTTGGSTTAVISPGAIALKIVPPGILALDVSIASSDSWGTQQPQFDVLFMSDAQWTQFKDPLGNPGRVGALKVSTTSFNTANNFWSQPEPQWIVLDNSAGYGATPPSFSSLTLTWSISFGPIRTTGGGGSTPATSPSCTAGSIGCQCRPFGLACDNGQCVSGFCQRSGTAPATSPISSPNQQTTPAGTGQTNPPFQSPTGNQPPTTSPTGIQPPITSQTTMPNGQVDCSDSAVFPQCLNAIFCQPGQKRMCICDSNGNVINKSCQGFATQPTQPTTQFQGLTTTAPSGGSCLSMCTSACGAKSVKNCMCNGAAVASFECGDVSSANKLVVALQAIVVAVMATTLIN